MVACRTPEDRTVFGCLTDISLCTQFCSMNVSLSAGTAAARQSNRSSASRTPTPPTSTVLEGFGTDGWTGAMLLAGPTSTPPSAVTTATGASGAAVYTSSAACACTADTQRRKKVQHNKIRYVQVSGTLIAGVMRSH